MTSKAVKTAQDALVITGFVAGIGWIGRKVLKEELTGNLASNVLNYVKMTAVIAGSIALKDYLETEKYIPQIQMASVLIMVGGAILNATAFIGGSYLAKAFGRKDSERLEEQKIHDLALEKYQRDVKAWNKKRQQYQDWLNEEYQNKIIADKKFENTDYAFKLYAKAHPDIKDFQYLKNKPQFSNYYQTSERQKI